MAVNRTPRATKNFFMRAILPRSCKRLATSRAMKLLIRSRSLVVGFVMAAACLALAPAASAQYFGQNKVQYRQLDFKVLRTDHFDIYFYPEEQAGTEIVARMAERWYARLS